MNQIAQIMAKPVGAVCNLDCKYCYYLGRMTSYEHARSIRMSDKVLERYIRSNIAQYSDSPAHEIWFSWQGGEPSLYGLSAFRQIVTLQNEICPPGKKICNAFQTNGFTIDGKWALFLAEHDFLVGISIDGPAHLHDHYRVDRGGHATCERVIVGLRHLQDAGVRVNALVTLNNQNVCEPSTVYQYIKGLGIEHIQFIPVVERQNHDRTITRVPQLDKPHPGDLVTNWSVDPHDYGRFLCAVFDQWSCSDIGSIFIQGFEEHLGAWMGNPAGLCIYSQTCGYGLALDYNGDVYSCDHYVYPEYNLGNILKSEFATLVRNPVQVAFGQAKKENLSKVCIECTFRFACHGGCPKHRFKTNSGSNFSDNYLCPGYRMFFQHADPVLRILKQALKMRRPFDEVMQQLRRRSVEIAKTKGKIGRNNPCPCHSGRKFKLCCG